MTRDDADYGHQRDLSPGADSSTAGAVDERGRLWRQLCQAEYKILIRECGNDGHPADDLPTTEQQAHAAAIVERLSSRVAIPSEALRRRAHRAAVAYGSDRGLDSDPDRFAPPDWAQAQADARWEAEDQYEARLYDGAVQAGACLLVDERGVQAAIDAAQAGEWDRAEPHYAVTPGLDRGQQLQQLRDELELIHDRQAEYGVEPLSPDPPERPASVIDDDLSADTAEDAVEDAARGDVDLRDDADGWFAGGYDAAHDAHLAALGHTDVLPEEDLPGEQPRVASAAVDVDEQVWAAGLPPEMIDGIEKRRTEPAQRDDPAELQARLDDLRAQVAASAGTPAGGWQTVGAEQAAHQLADRGADLDTARAMVAEYLRETSQRAGAPAQQWGLDQGDLDTIAADHRLPTPLPPAAALAALGVDEHLAEQDSADHPVTDQVGRWDGDDHIHDGADTSDAGAGYRTADDAAADGAEWSR